MKCSMISILCVALLVQSNIASPFFGGNFDIPLASTLTTGAKAAITANVKVTASIAPIKIAPTASADLTTAATLLVQLVNNITMATNAPLNQFIAGVADKKTVTATLFANLDATIISTVAAYGNMATLIDGIGAVISTTVTGNFTAALATLQTEMGNLQSTYASIGSSIGSLDVFNTTTANRLITTDVQTKLSDSYTMILAAISQLEITTKNAVTIIVSANTLTATVNTAGTAAEKNRVTANATIIPAMNKLITATATTLNAVGPMVKSAFDKVITKIQVFSTDTVVTSATTTISTIQTFEMDGAAAATTINTTIVGALTTEIQLLTDAYTTNTVALINTTAAAAVNQIINDVKMGTANASVCATKVIPKILTLEATAIMKASACLSAAIMQLNADNMATLAALKVLQATAISPSVSLSVCTSYATSASSALPAKILLDACLQGETSVFGSLTTDLQALGTKNVELYIAENQFTNDKLTGCFQARINEFNLVLTNLQNQYNNCLMNSAIAITRLADAGYFEDNIDADYVEPEKEEIINVEVIDAKTSYVKI